MQNTSRLLHVALAGFVAVAGLGAPAFAQQKPAVAQAATTMIPALARSLMPGEIITENDITWLTVPARQVSQTIIGDSDGLIGRAVRRPVAANMPVRFSDVQRPVLIKRGAIVKMTVKTNNMVLTTTGRAQENGSEGDVIRLVNMSSNKTLSGTVLSARDVMISDAQHVGSHIGSQASLARSPEF